MTSPDDPQHRKDVEVNFTIDQSIEEIRENFSPILAMFDELKKAASFIYDFAAKSGINNDQIAPLKEKIDNLFVDLNESIMRASSRLHDSTMGNGDILKDSAINGTYVAGTPNSVRQDFSYEKLFGLYNEALEKVVAFEAEKTQLVDNFNELQNRNAELMGQVDFVEKEKKGLEDKLQKALRELAEEKAKSAAATLNVRNKEPPARVAPQEKPVLTPDLSDKVTAELKRIYTTLHRVKSNTENIRNA